MCVRARPGYALTLIDSLDMLAIVGDYSEFRRAVKVVVRDVSFDKDVVVSVFESTIRVMGGLLSAHLLASDPAYAIMPEYKGELLDMAVELGWRLLPAFNTTTGLPVHRVHLQRGVLPTEPRETCTAAAGTLVLEFGVLSRVSGEPLFERLARRALKGLWDRRSALNLLGSNIDVGTGIWKNPYAGTGAGVDSFYEYLLKSYIVLHDPALLQMFLTARRAVHKVRRPCACMCARSRVYVFAHPPPPHSPPPLPQHLQHSDVFMEGNMHHGHGMSRQPYVSALQAFWPGLETLAGDPSTGTRLLRPMLQLWRRYQAIPEMFDLASMSPVHYARDSPLRPELVESIYLVYTVTRHPSLLHAGEEILRALNKYCKVKCGYASIADVVTKRCGGGAACACVNVCCVLFCFSPPVSPPPRLDDRMDSYFLSETAKYLFLLFDASLMSHGHLSFYPQRLNLSQAAFQAVRPSYLTECNRTVGVGQCEREGVCAAVPRNMQLAAQVRSNRSTVPALPYDPLQALWTTEGHLLLMKAGALRVYPTFDPSHTAYKPRRKRRHSGASYELTQETCHLPVEGWQDVFNPHLAGTRNESMSLDDRDLECPVVGEEQATLWDVSPVMGAETYFRNARESVAQQQARLAAAASPPQQMVSELVATFNKATQVFEVAPWTHVSALLLFLLCVGGE